MKGSERRTIGGRGTFVLGRIQGWSSSIVLEKSVSSYGNLSRAHPPTQEAVCRPCRSGRPAAGTYEPRNTFGAAICNCLRLCSHSCAALGRLRFLHTRGKAGPAGKNNREDADAEEAGENRRLDRARAGPKWHTAPACTSLPTIASQCRFRRRQPSPPGPQALQAQESWSSQRNASNAA